MNEKQVKSDIGFQEALRRIAHTPKKSIKEIANEKDATLDKADHESKKQPGRKVRPKA